MEEVKVGCIKVDIKCVPRMSLLNYIIVRGYFLHTIHYVVVIAKFDALRLYFDEVSTIFHLS